MSPSRPWYRREAWLVVALAACIPVLLASVVPTAWKIPLVGLSGVLVTAALVMTLRRDRAVRAEEAAHHLEPSDG